MESKPLNTPKWKSVELAVFSVWTCERIVSGDGLSVRYDVDLRDLDGDDRQFDVVVFDSTGEVLQVFEVQDRGRPLAKDIFGGFVDKMQEVSAPELNVVTRSGTTKPVQKRVERENASGKNISTFTFSEPAIEFEGLETVTMSGISPGGPSWTIDLDFETRYLECTAATVVDPLRADVIFGTGEVDATQVWATIMVVELRDPFLLIVSHGEVTDAEVDVRLEFTPSSGRPTMTTSAIINPLPM